jgi:hypothetical protein
MQEACGAIVAVEFLDIRDMMRLVRRSIDTASIRHVLRLGTLTIRGSEAITKLQEHPHNYLSPACGHDPGRLRNNNLSRACGLSAGASRERSPRESRGG